MATTVKQEYIKAFEKTEKLGLVATIDDRGDPHISLLTTLMAADEKRMVVGQFSQGLSKKNMAERHKTGFAIMGLDMSFWTGRMDWTGKATEGEEYVRYNQMQMWRFNTYFGIDTVHYFDLKDISEKRKLDLLGIGLNAVKAILKKGVYKTDGKEQVMRPFAEKLFNGLGNPKFISFIDKDGYPVIVPIVQAQSAGSDVIVFSAKPYAEDLKELGKDARVAVFCADMDMKNVLVKGTFGGFEKGMGRVVIDRVYNSLPPICRYVYPYEEYGEVTEF